MHKCHSLVLLSDHMAHSCYRLTPYPWLHGHRMLSVTFVTGLLYKCCKLPQHFILCIYCKCCLDLDIPMKWNKLMKTQSKQLRVSKRHFSETPSKETPYDDQWVKRSLLPRLPAYACSKRTLAVRRAKPTGATCTLWLTVQWSAITLVLQYLWQ